MKVPRKRFLASQDTKKSLIPPNPYFLDGSGGTMSRDPRLRRCGWAWVQPDRQCSTYPLWHTAGKYGTLPGRQTVTRAEMWALLKALQFLQAYALE